MAKFYLPEAKQQKQKKKTDYRIIIFEKLLRLVKLKHLEYISKVIKQIK